MIEIFVSLIPVFIFLIILIYFDSYKLVKLNTILLLILAGCAAALFSYGINKRLLNSFQINGTSYARYIAPVIEESIKASFILFMISKKKIGFMVDAAIYGFAVGAGFALVENIYYLSVINSSSIFLWIIRGFGTAVMHGGTTAIFAILAKNMFDRSDKISLYLTFIPGLLLAILIHSIFNHLLLPAIGITLLQLFLLPLLISYVFYRNEIALRKWMEIGLDNEIKLLEQIENGTFSESHAGQYLLSLQHKFAGIVLADMLCSIKLHVELSMKAKGVLLFRKAGLPVTIGDDIKDKLNELKYLEKSIGATGRLAIDPIFKMSSKDLWQLYMLGS